MEFIAKTDLPRTKYREAIFLILYTFSFSEEGDKALLPFVSDQLKVNLRYIKDANVFAKEIWNKRDEIDDKIEAVSHDYKLHRIPKVELAILRLAIYELFYCESMPYRVVIAEAIRLGRKFGNQECFKFVNAVLDAIYQSNIQLQNAEMV